MSDYIDIFHSVDKNELLKIEKALQSAKNIKLNKENLMKTSCLNQ